MTDSITSRKSGVKEESPEERAVKPFERAAPFICASSYNMMIRPKDRITPANLGLHLSPLVRVLLTRFGGSSATFVQVPDPSAIPAPITDDLTFTIEPPGKPEVVRADREALQ